MKKIKDWLLANGMTMTDDYVFVYLIAGEQLTLSLDEILKGVNRKMGSEDSTILALENIKKFYSNSLYVSDDQNKKDFLLSVGDFLREMGMNEAYVGITDLTWEELAANYDFTVEFLRWWSEEKGISEQQMLCDHNTTDTYAKDGMFYNSVGECRKCNCPENGDIENAEDIELIWKAWNHRH